MNSPNREVACPLHPLTRAPPKTTTMKKKSRMGILSHTIPGLLRPLAQARVKTMTRTGNLHPGTPCPLRLLARTPQTKTKIPEVTSTPNHGVPCSLCPLTGVQPKKKKTTTTTRTGGPNPGTS